MRIAGRPPLRPILLAGVALVTLLSGCREAGLYDELGPLNQPPDELRLGPGEVTLQPSDSTLFAAIGGEAPYTYAVVSGSGIIDPVTGIYAAPGSLSNETVRVTDSEGATATSSVRVVSSSGDRKSTRLNSSHYS